MNTKPQKEYEKIADYFIGLSNETGSLITNLKLQKLVYYAQAWSLALNNEELFADDFQAWVHGPVLVSLYDRYRTNKWNPIDKEVDIDSLKESLCLKNLKLLEDVADIYLELDAYKLEKLTHLEEPWIEARGGIPENEPCRSLINKNTMRQYYSSLI